MNTFTGQYVVYYLLHISSHHFKNYLIQTHIPIG